MGLVDRILSFFVQCTNRTRKSHVQDSPLCQLPTELVLSIGSYLSCVDVACLALCCHQLLFQIGTGSLLFSKSNDSRNRETFLTRLSQDIPKYYFCHTCALLHLWAKVRLPGPGIISQGFFLCFPRDHIHDLWVCSSLWVSTYTFRRTEYHFYFVHLQLAMRRYRYGPEYGISTDSLSSVEVCRPESDDEIMTLFSVEARVCPQQNGRVASLCLRVQQWATIRCSPTDMDSLLDKTSPTRICTHIESPPSWDRRLRKLHAEHGHSPSPDNITFQCDHCRVDYQFQLREFQIRGAEKALALTITKWLDLGEGLDPREPLWTANTGLDGIDKLDIPRDVGSVRQDFEREPGLSQDALTSRNEFLLKEERFRRELRRWSSTKWIHGGQRLGW